MNQSSEQQAKTAFKAMSTLVKANFEELKDPPETRGATLIAAIEAYNLYCERAGQGTGIRSIYRAEDLAQLVSDVLSPARLIADMVNKGKQYFMTQTASGVSDATNPLKITKTIDDSTVLQIIREHIPQITAYALLHQSEPAFRGWINHFVAAPVKENPDLLNEVIGRQ